MDKREYKARVQARARMAARKTERDSRDRYVYGKMAVRMPVGCWIWVAALGAGVVMAFKACFL